MLNTRRPRASGGRRAHTPLVLALTLLGAGSGLGCKGDEPTGPAATGNAPSLDAAGHKTIIVSNSAELVAALVPENVGLRILVRAGTYAIDAPLTVPDGVTLEGEGVMRFDGAGLPVGFAAGTQTTLSMSSNVPGNLLALGNGVTIRGLEIADLPGRAGNVIGVVSRAAGDRVSATIAESEIVNPNPIAGAIGYGLLVITDNPSAGSPHEGAALTARVERSLIRSPAGGGGLFAFNFAALGSVSVTLAGNVIGGEITANGGVSRPDAVHDSRTRIESRRNLYRDDSADPCTSPRSIGWNLAGGSSPPLPIPVAATARNMLRVHSVDDRIERFTTGVIATGTRRFFALAGPSTDNSLDLELLGTTISTPSCGGAGFVRDLVLIAADAPFAELAPGDGNSLRAVIRGVTGSGTRFNRYGDVLGPSGPLPAALEGTGNRLEIVGNLNAFARTNRDINPLPGTEFFTGGAP